MSVIRKKQEEKNLKILRELLTFEGNRYCFDCNQRGPTYVNITIGSFVCTNCSGALRKYSHRLKSISMSNFSQTEMDFIKKRGNNICKKIYYGLCENNVPPELDIKNGMLDSHLRAKYELKKWFLEPPTDLEEETIVQNQAIFDRVERGVPKVVKSYTVNSSSNIIIEPPKQQTANKLVSTKGNRASIDLVEGLSSFNNASQRKSSNDITNVIDPSKLGGGTAVKLPSASDNKTTSSSWLPNTDIKTEHNTQSPFGDDFLFPSANEKPVSFTPISKSQTMNFSMPPLVPMSQAASDSHSITTAAPAYRGELKGSDKYAALAELDDLFSNSSSISTQPTPTAFSPTWDSGVPAGNSYAWYGGAGGGSQYQTATSNPFSGSTVHHQVAPTFNPFTSLGDGTVAASQVPMNWPGSSVLSPVNNGSANPFLNTTSKNPFL